MKTTALLWAVVIGALTPIQVGINAKLHGLLAHPMLAVTVNMVVGALCVGLLVAVMRVPLPSAGALAALPWWGWLGGVIGAVFVASTLLLGPKLGAAALLALIVAGQMFASMALDHFGVLGFPLNPISFWRTLGAVLLVMGVVLIVRN